MDVDQYIELLKELGFHNKEQPPGGMKQNEGALALRGRSLSETIYFNHSQYYQSYFFAERRDPLFPRRLWDDVPKDSLKKKDQASSKIALLPKPGREKEALELLAELEGVTIEHGHDVPSEVKASFGATASGGSDSRRSYGDSSRRRDMPVMTGTELLWLDYAWCVVNCPQSHLTACIKAGAAVPGIDRVDGNELRLPGYLGRNYRPGGILCVAAVGREPSLEDEKKNPENAKRDARLFKLTRKWIEAGRSPENDLQYLQSVRLFYEEALPGWRRWRRHFNTLVESYLKMSVSDIAYTNLAKWRVPIHRGQQARQAEARLTRLCQSDFIPIREIVDILRPVAVLVGVLGAGRNGDIVERWDGEHCSPLVYAWQGQSGHDRHNTAKGARPLREWAPDMAQEVRSRLKHRTNI